MTRKRVRKFNGIKYGYSGTFPTKANAERMAKLIVKEGQRMHGYKDRYVRIVRHSDGYSLYLAKRKRRRR